MKLLFIGDSLIEFYNWQARFPNYPVSNLGVAGETVEELLDRTKIIIKRRPAPDMILIMIGTNNMVMENFTFIPAYEKIIETFRTAYPQTTTVITSLLPMQVQWLEGTAIQRINDRLATLASDKGVQFLNVYQHFIDEQGQVRRNYFLEDGVHLSNEGYSAWSAAVEKFLGATEGPR